MTSTRLANLADEFWEWRTRTQPDSGDDVPRVERSPGWVADWSAGAVADRRHELADLTERYRRIDLAAEAVTVQVDGRLLGSALARGHWELNLLRGWQRNPCFYLDQSLVPIFNLLLPPPPFGDERTAAIIRHLGNVPVVLEQGRRNLAGHAAAPFAEYALRLLATGTSDVEQAMKALASVVPERRSTALLAASKTAVNGLKAFRDWLDGRSFTGEVAVGPVALAFFLHRVAMLPFSAERLRAIGRDELNRAVAAEAIVRRRRRDVPPPVTTDLATRQRAAELDVRGFYVDNGILGQPHDLRHYRFAVTPPYLAPLTWLGVTHDPTSPARIDEDAVCYLPEPEADLPYFARAKAMDPRTGIVHEGVHAQQLALSWRHPNPARRHFYDSTPNEGIAFYNEELMFLAGLFDDAPASATFIANSMRLRALRVEVDLGLALGEVTLDQVADRLAEAVPMDRTTAWEEAASFAGNPGQGLSYQTGKAQVLDLLATCERANADFDLQRFHDRLWREGNVPLALQRWELLGLSDHLAEADRLAPHSG